MWLEGVASAFGAIADNLDQKRNKLHHLCSGSPFPWAILSLFALEVKHFYFDKKGGERSFPALNRKGIDDTSPLEHYFLLFGPCFFRHSPPKEGAI
jgi:hypothetical protein